jgi:hypothetical protein
MGPRKVLRIVKGVAMIGVVVLALGLLARALMP